MKLSDFDSLVFSGGGGRCIWQAGFCETLFRQKELKIDQVAGVSAGATIACFALVGKTEEGLRYFKKVTAQNRKNMYLENIFNKNPVFPQYNIYRQSILDLFDPAALSTLKSGPSFNVLITKPPSWIGPRLGTVIGFSAYMVEKKLKNPLHPSFACKLGYTPVIIPISSCNTTDDLAELLLQSSCTPPFVPVMKRNGFPALDGGIIDNVPVKAISGSKGRILVLLTRQYPADLIKVKKERVYIQPSQPITIKKWDYTNPDGLQIVYDLGKSDAERFLQNCT
ncbi:patatin-like phospholipase family protein [bacterium]|nr:patatin-like phospholipase family protein [bacterium]